MAAYVPEADGNIPMPVQVIASVGEACHDFTIARSKLSVVNLRKDLIRNIGMEHYQKTEHDISKLLHREFNGGIDTKKANLDLSDTSKVYSTLKQLREDLFFGSDGVNPLVFTIPAAKLGEFQPVLNELKSKFSSYGFIPDVTHDAYSRPGLLGNPMAATIKYSSATTCDSGTAGSSGVVLKAAMDAGNFIMNNPLVTGKSYWGTWTIHTNTTASGQYGGARVNIQLNNLTLFPAVRPFDITLPRALTRSPSVNELSLMLDGVISGMTNDQILQSIKKHLDIPSIRTFYTEFIGHIRRLHATPPFGLILILIWKEMGDMSQHLVAVTQKHIAGGTVDGLSSIAFLKRSVAISYIIASIKGLDHVRFRVAGTSHMLAGNPADMARRQAEAVAAEEARLAAIDKRQADKAAMKEAIRAAALAERAEIEQARAFAKAEAAAKRAARSVGRGSARKNKLIGGSRWKKTVRKLRKNKHRNKTYKQKGGANISADDLIDRLIDVLFDYSLAASAPAGGGGLPPTCSLFNVKDAPSPITPEYIDLTLAVLGDYGVPIFMDNEVLGLPLASILYSLPQNLPEDITPEQIHIIIEDFLKSFNFTDEEITYIVARVIATASSSLGTSSASASASASAPTEAVAAPPKLGNVFREGTDSDKETLQLLVDNYGAIIPGFTPTIPEIIPEEEVGGGGGGGEAFYNGERFKYLNLEEEENPNYAQTMSQQQGNASAPNHNTLISEFVDSLDYKKFIELKEYIKRFSPDVGSGGAMPFGTPPRPLMQRVDITVPKLNELGQYIQSLLQKKGTRGRGGGGGGGGGASVAGGAGGEPVAPKFNPQEIELLRRYIQEKQEKEQQLFAALLSGRKSPSGARNNLAGGDNSPSLLKAQALGGRGSPVPIGRGSPAPIGRGSPAPIGGGSPVPLGRASPLPIGRASPKPRHFPRRSRKNSTFRK